MRIGPTLVPAVALVLAGVLGMPAGPAAALPTKKQNKIKTCESAIVDAQQDFFGAEIDVFRACAKAFLEANIQDSPAKETALAAAKTACVAQLNSLENASTSFVDAVTTACTPAAGLLFTKPSDPTGFQELFVELSRTDINTVPELALFLCASKTVFAVLLAAYETPRGSQLYSNYVTNELHKQVTDFLDPRCSPQGGGKK